MEKIGQYLLGIVFYGSCFAIPLLLISITLYIIRYYLDLSSNTDKLLKIFEILLFIPFASLALCSGVGMIFRLIG